MGAEIECGLDYRRPEVQALARITKLESELIACKTICEQYSRNFSAEISKNIDLNKRIIALEENNNQKEHQWQPIETSPKDGSRILCSHKGNHVYIAKYECRGTFVDDYNVWQAPTHWMPIPSTQTIEVAIKEKNKEKDIK